jgi:plastocyanin
MHARTLLQALVVMTLCVSCGGSGGYGGDSSQPPTTPSPTGTSNVVTITITGVKGTLSFSPNPASCATGQMVVWKNADSITHRVQIDDLGVSTGDIAPGASSQPMSLANVSKGYHCSLHPQMVGALNGAATPAPGEDCGPYGC